jgi:hypothetical protein
MKEGEKKSQRSMRKNKKRKKLYNQEEEFSA